MNKIEIDSLYRLSELANQVKVDLSFYHYGAALSCVENMQTWVTKAMMSLSHQRLRSAVLMKIHDALQDLRFGLQIKDLSRCILLRTKISTIIKLGLQEANVESFPSIQKDGVTPSAAHYELQVLNEVVATANSIVTHVKSQNTDSAIYCAQLIIKNLKNAIMKLVEMDEESEIMVFLLNCARGLEFDCKKDRDICGMYHAQTILRAASARLDSFAA